MSDRLAPLDAAETDAFPRHFVPVHRRRGSIVTGRARDGGLFSLHLSHDGGMRPDILQRALRYIGVSRDEYDSWRMSR